MVYKGSLESHVRAGRLSEKDARNIAKLLQIDFDLNRKIPWWKKIFHKNQRAGALFFVYNYHLTKPHKCAIINLDPPLGGRRSRNSHYTTSFKKSQIKSHCQIAQSFFPKSHSFCATCTTRLCGRTPAHSPYATHFVWQPGPGRICPPRRQKVGPSKFFLPIGRPARRVNFPIWPPLCYKLSLLPAKIFLLSPLKNLIQQQRQNESSRAKFTSHENLSVSNSARQIDL